MINLKNIFILLCLLIMGIKESIAQLHLSQDPLYAEVWGDEFDSTKLRSYKWATHWPWSKANMVNKNKEKRCLGNDFPGDTVDIAYTYSAPQDTATRKFLSSGGVNYQRMISKKENYNGGVTVYHYPYSLSYCNAHGGAYGVDASGNAFCYYDSVVPFKYTTAMIYSKRKFKYGYFEIKYRLPDNLAPSDSNAYGPNFWMWAGDATADYSEIDIFEQSGRDWSLGPNAHFRKQTTPTANWQDTAFFHAVGSSTTSVTPYIANVVTGATGGNWFTVGCEWTPDYIDFYYNSEIPHQRFTKELWPGVQGNCPMAIIADCYMPALQYCIPFINGSTFQPFSYDIDYIKVYQVKQNCVSKSFLITSSSTYADTLWQDLTIGGVGGNATFNSGIKHLAAQDYVLIDEGFVADGNGTVIISTMPCQSDQTNAANTPTYPSYPSNATLRSIETSKRSTEHY